MAARCARCARDAFRGDSNLCSGAWGPDDCSTIWSYDDTWGWYGVVYPVVHWVEPQSPGYVPDCWPAWYSPTPEQPSRPVDKLFTFAARHGFVPFGTRWSLDRAFCLLRQRAVPIVSLWFARLRESTHAARRYSGSMSHAIEWRVHRPYPGSLLREWRHYARVTRLAADRVRRHQGYYRGVWWRWRKFLEKSRRVDCTTSMAYNCWRRRPWRAWRALCTQRRVYVGTCDGRLARAWRRWRCQPTNRAPRLDLSGRVAVRPGLARAWRRLRAARAWRRQRARPLAVVVKCVGRSRLRRALRLLRVHVGGAALARLKSIAQEFADCPTVFLDGFLGVDRAMLTPGVAAATRALLRVARLAEQSMENVALMQQWIAVRNQFGKAVNGQCGNLPMRGRDRGGCRARGCLACTRCGVRYCSPECRAHHHDVRGHALLCGLDLTDSDARRLVVEACTQFIRSLPSTHESPILAVLAVVARVATAMLTTDMGAPLDWLHPSRLGRAARRAELTRVFRSAVVVPAPANRITQLADQAMGHMATRDIMECLMMALVRGDLADLHASDQYLALALHAEVDRPFWCMAVKTRRVYDIRTNEKATNLSQTLRARLLGPVAQALAAPPHEFFRAFVYAGTDKVPNARPLHPADTRRGPGTVLCRTMALLSAETEVWCTAELRSIARAEISQIGSRRHPLLHRMTAIVYGQFPGYPSHADACDRGACLSLSGDPEIALQLTAMEVQDQCARTTLQIVAHTYSQENARPLVVALVGPNGYLRRAGWLANWLASVLLLARVEITMRRAGASAEARASVGTGFAAACALSRWTQATTRRPPRGVWTSTAGVAIADLVAAVYLPEAAGGTGHQLVSYLRHERGLHGSNRASDRMLMCTIRTALYAAQVSDSTMAQILAQCCTALRLRHPLVQALRSWKANARFVDDAINHVSIWLPSIARIEAEYPRLGSAESPSYWWVARQLADFQALGEAALGGEALSIAAWRACQHDRATLA